MRSLYENSAFELGLNGKFTVIRANSEPDEVRLDSMGWVYYGRYMVSAGAWAWQTAEAKATLSNVRGGSVWLPRTLVRLNEDYTLRAVDHRGADSNYHSTLSFLRHAPTWLYEAEAIGTTKRLLLNDRVCRVKFSAGEVRSLWKGGERTVSGIDLNEDWGLIFRTLFPFV